MEYLEWKKRYIARLIKGGYTEGWASSNFEAIGHEIDLDDSPEDAADDELSYMASDSLNSFPSVKGTQD